MPKLVDKQISTCFRSIRNLLYFVSIIGTGVAGTIGFTETIVKHFGNLLFDVILAMEFTAIAVAILHIIFKFVRIEILNLKERNNA